MLLGTRQSSAKTVIYSVFTLTLLWLGVFCLRAPTAFAARVNFTPSTIALNEGQSQTISITLSEPIVAPGPDPAYVELPLTSSNPGRLSISPSSINYTAGQWSQTKTFTITAIDDSLDNGDTVVTLSSTTNSNSEFYSNFVASSQITIIDNDEASVTENNHETTTSPTSTQSQTNQLAETGSNTSHVLRFLSWSIIISMLVLLVFRNQLQQ